MLSGLFLFFFCVVFPRSGAFADIAQLGERQTEDLKVPGSIPGVGNIRFFCRTGRPASQQVVHVGTPYHGILAEWLRRLIRNQLGTFPREFESLRCRSRVLVAQWIAHQTSNLGVAGSNPVENAFWIFWKPCVCALAALPAIGLCHRLYSSVGRASAS